MTSSLQTPWGRANKHGVRFLRSFVTSPSRSHCIVTHNASGISAVHTFLKKPKRILGSLAGNLTFALSIHLDTHFYLAHSPTVCNMSTGNPQPFIREPFGRLIFNATQKLTSKFVWPQYQLWCPLTRRTYLKWQIANTPSSITTPDTWSAVSLILTVHWSSHK